MTQIQNNVNSRIDIVKKYNPVDNSQHGIGYDNIDNIIITYIISTATKIGKYSIFIIFKIKTSKMNTILTTPVL